MLLVLGGVTGTIRWTRVGGAMGMGESRQILVPHVHFPKVALVMPHLLRGGSHAFIAESQAIKFQNAPLLKIRERKVKSWGWLCLYLDKG